MLHADLNRRHRLVDRRYSPRSDSSAEMVLAWNHDLTQRIRARVLDVSEVGMKILSSMPIVQGMTGIAISLLPQGVDVNRVFQVMWVKDADGGNGCEAGVRFLS